MTQPQKTAKKKTTKRSTKNTEAKMAELSKEGEAILAADAKKGKRKKPAKRKKATATKKKPAAKRKAAPKAKTAAKKPAAKKAAAKPKPAPADDHTPKRGRRAVPGQDPRIPPVGTTIVRPYKGEEHRVTVLADGFRWNDGVYSSLSKLASAITGAKSINGLLWFRLTEPKQAD